MLQNKSLSLGGLAWDSAYGEVAPLPALPGSGQGKAEKLLPLSSLPVDGGLHLEPWTLDLPPEQTAQHL